MTQIPTTLSIAGFDATSGAGIQADLKTFSALGCYGMTVLTALPIQNTQGVKSIYEIPVPCIEEQLSAIFEDVKVNHIKIGMVHHSKNMEAISILLHDHTNINIVLDPVMMPKCGNSLLQTNAVHAMKTQLFPLVTVLTPNLPEASILLGKEIKTRKQMEEAALELLQQGPKAILLKGGHLLDGDCDDVLCIDNQCHWYQSPRIQTPHTHGTGCTLSSAITAFLAHGDDIPIAVEKAKEYISNAIAASHLLKIGKGHGPVHHFFSFWEKTQE